MGLGEQNLQEINGDYTNYLQLFIANFPYLFIYIN
jgi:hypothetical protein